MTIRQKKIDDEIKIYLSSGQKKQIQRMAELSKKSSVSEYARDVLLSQTLDTAKMEFYQSVNENLTELKKANYVLTRLLLLLGTKVLGDEDSVISFYKEMAADAENKFEKI